MKEVMGTEIPTALAKCGVVAVLEIDNIEDAIPTAQALLSSGITVIELALRTKVAMSAIEAIHRELPEMMIGSGTVILHGQAEQVKKAGASFGVSPGFNRLIVEEAIRCDLPFAPGIATATDIEAAIAVGCKVLKFFPATPMGGVSYLKSVTAPYMHLGLKYFPLGGVTEENLAEYAVMPNVIAIGGSWIAKRDLIKSKNWAEIERRACKAVERWKNARSEIL